MTILDIIAITLAIIHFGVPVAYYYYMKTKYLNKPWNINFNPSYEPKITIIVPTYNEAKLIEKKLDNIHEQDYPRNKLEIIVVDSGSTDRTPELVKKWAKKHPDMNLKLIVEKVRRGKAYALNNALKHATGEIVVITDVDSLWPDRETLRKTVNWFSDPMVGAVSCLKKPVGSGVRGVEESYRQYYNVLRIAESKAYATPIFHGELAAFRRDLLEKVGGFPTDIGADDSHTATRIALMGYRAITPEDQWAEELVPNKGYFWWKVRRAQHLIQHFIKTLQEIGKAPKEFRKILVAEAFLHIVNPYLLLASTIPLMMNIALAQSLVALALLILGIALLVMEPYRTWITQQIHLITASIRNLWTKETAWNKQVK
ncbi:MAG: glycosyl transferase [Desulfurococcales archaeon ex4484_217_2]|nr:MAG: glycosyl transferase [Desulfurococcales archaeon ex4484_217_2]